MLFVFFLMALFGVSCSSEPTNGLNNLNEIRKEFVDTVLSESCLDEGPFKMDYQLRTILSSDNVVSLFGEVFVYAHLPHGWSRYEGKTFVRDNGAFKEITLEDLFPKKRQKEFLRSYCEGFLKNKSDDCSYFQGSDPLL